MSGNWLDAFATSNRYIQTYVKGFIDISGGNLLLRPGNNHIIVQGGDISLNGRLFIGTSVLSGDGPTVTSGNVFVGNYVAANTLPTIMFIPGNVMTPVTLSATADRWTNTNISWAVAASSNANGFSPYMAFTANIAGNVAVAGNVVGNGWLSATAGYNTTTGLYTGTTYTTPVSTIGNVAGEWIQIGATTATALTGFQLVATNDSTGAHNDRLPTAFTIVGIPALSGLTASLWGTSNAVPVGTLWVAVGVNISYSYNGILWTSVPGLDNANTVTTPYDIAYSGTMWIFVNNRGYLWYSYTGINWTYTANPLGTGLGIATNVTMWVMGSIGTHALGYSYNGINWTGLGTAVMNRAYQPAYSGTMWVVGGNGTNNLAYSYNGTQWTCLLYTSPSPRDRTRSRMPSSA